MSKAKGDSGLLPCPLLGHEPLGGSDAFGPGPYVSVSGSSDSPRFYGVVCPSCCSTAYSGSREGAIKLWNTRTPSTSPPADDPEQNWCDHCSADLNSVRHILCEKCYRKFAGPKWWDKDFNPEQSSPDVDSQPAEYVRGVKDAAKIARDEFARSPEAARDHDSVWMGGYEDACDHLSIEIEKLTEGYSAPPNLEWAAQWIEGSLKGETNERVIEFGRNMVMTFRAALLPTDARPQPVASEPKENDDRRL